MSVDSPRASRSEVHPASDSSHPHRSASLSGIPWLIFATFSGGWKSSPSASSQPTRSWTARATVDFPEPETPMKTRWSGASVVVISGSPRRCSREERSGGDEERRGEFSSEGPEAEGEHEDAEAERGLHDGPGPQRRLDVHPEEPADQPEARVVDVGQHGGPRR